jgi:hypothetical protein
VRQHERGSERGFVHVLEVRLGRHEPLDDVGHMSDKSVVEDITLESHPGNPRPAVVVPSGRTYTIRDLRELGRDLHELTEKMNEAICRAEDAFLERLGESARGRVELRRGEEPIFAKKKSKKGKREVVGKRSWVTFLIYRDGEFFVESNRPGDGTRFVDAHILSTSREIRILACNKMAELWEACSGQKVPIRQVHPKGVP